MADNFLKIYNGTTYDPRVADPSNPVEGDVQFSDGTARAKGLWEYKSGSWTQLAGGGGGSAQEIVYLQEVQTAGVNGGTTTGGTWQTRILNTVTGDTAIVSLATNQFTLQSGKYSITSSAPAYGCGRHIAKLYNITDAVDVLEGTSEYVATPSGGDVQTRSFVEGIIDITSAKVFEIQHKTTSTSAAVGFGISGSLSTNEVYTIVKITKLS